MRGAGVGFLALAVESDVSLVPSSAVLVELTLGHPRGAEAREKGHSAGVQGQNSAPLLPAFLGLLAGDHRMRAGPVSRALPQPSLLSPQSKHSMSRAPERTAQSSCTAEC